MDYINRFYDGYRDLMDNKSDQRTTDWLLMSSPLPTIAICLSYAYFVKVSLPLLVTDCVRWLIDLRNFQILGPKLMENRKPFKLRNVLVVYNFAQVLFSLWLFYEASSAGWFAGYSYRCQPVDTSRSPIALRVKRN